MMIASIAIGDAEIWNDRVESIATTFASLSKIRSKQMREVQPMRIRLVTLPQEATIADVHQKTGAVVDVATLARINHVTAEQVLPKGRVVKVVKGFNPAMLDAAAGG